MNNDDKKKNDLLTLNTFLNVSPDHYLILDNQYKILKASETYLKKIQCTKDEVIGKDIFSILLTNQKSNDTNEFASLLNSLNQVIFTKKPHTISTQKYYFYSRCDDSNKLEECYLNLQHVPILDDDNSVKYIIHRIEDVSKEVELHKSIHIQKNKTRNLSTSYENPSFEIGHNTDIEDMNLNF